ncbi:MAG TPA: YncE family protein [Terracidiphilus sp.]|nr:YncE family protein [Terracidiphilus sp.]
MSKIFPLAALAFMAAFPEFVLPATAQSGAAYRIGATYKLPGAAPIDAVWLDISSRRLYVAHSDHVDVLNADTGRSEGSMPAQDASGIVVVDASRGFFANRGSGSVTLFNPASLAIIKTVPLQAKSPASLVYDADAKRIFVMAPGSGEVLALNAGSGDLEGRIALKGNLRQAVTNEMGSLFVAAQDMNLIHVVDTHSLKFLGDFPSGNAVGPVSLAIDPAGRRLFVACSDGKLAVIDTDIGFTFEELPIVSGAVASLFTFSPQGKGGWKGADFVAGENGALTLVQMNAFIRYSVGGKVSIPNGAHAIAFDPKTHRLFLAVSAPQPEVLALQPASAEVDR